MGGILAESVARKELTNPMIPFLSLLAGGPVLMAGLTFGGGRTLDQVVNLILALLIAIDVHELGHAVVADRLGDDTPRRAGHLSLNPFRHMDQFGILLLFLTAISSQGFTYGFTPINDRKLRERTPAGPALVAVAGPLMNLLLAAIVGVYLAHSFLGGGNGLINGNARLFDFLSTLMSINVFLFVFNLFPLPPLDGWAIVHSFLTPRKQFEVRRFVQYGPFVLLLLLVFEGNLHFFSSVVYPMTDWVTGRLLQL